MAGFRELIDEDQNADVLWLWLLRTFLHGMETGDSICLDILVARTIGNGEMELCEEKSPSCLSGSHIYCPRDTGGSRGR